MLEASNHSLMSKKPHEFHMLQRKLDEQELDLDLLRDQLSEREREVRMLTIKLKEFKHGADSITLSDVQQLELEAMLAEKKNSSILQRLQYMYDR